jgi:rare lipoprotein A (peptidoglycan hydrolase)
MYKFTLYICLIFGFFTTNLVAKEVKLQVFASSTEKGAINYRNFIDSHTESEIVIEDNLYKLIYSFDTPEESISFIERHGLNSVKFLGSNPIYKDRFTGKYVIPFSATEGYSEEGFVSYYSRSSSPYKTTSNFEIYREDASTAAHRGLYFGTYLKVSNLENGKETFVRINDRGPFVANGSAMVKITVVDEETYKIAHSL